MAWYDNLRTITVEAGSAITIYRFVNIAADGQIDTASSAQGNVDGIAGTSETVVGSAVPVVVPDGGIAKVEAGAATTAGGLAATDAMGRAINYVEAANNIAVGKFVSAASAAGDIVEMQFVHKKTGGGT